MNDTPWMDLAKKLIGTPGNYEQYFQYTNTAFDPNLPWSAAFMCAMLERAGYSSPHSANASDFSSYGNRTTLVYGAIVVLTFPDNSMHVTFCECIDKNKIMVKCIGGNQAALVAEDHFKLEYVTDVRWPVK